MNFGDCPYEGCTGRFWEPVPDRTPAWARLTCETCGRIVWYKFSRIDPEAYTVEDFEKEFIVDEETKSIRERNPPSPEVKAFSDALAHDFAVRYDHITAFGMEHTCDECEPNGGRLIDALLSSLAKGAAPMRQVSSVTIVGFDSANIPRKVNVAFADGGTTTSQFGEDGVAHVYDPDGGIQAAPVIDVTCINTSGEISIDLNAGGEGEGTEPPADGKSKPKSE